MTAQQLHTRSHRRFRLAPPAMIALALAIIMSVAALLPAVHATPQVSGSATSSVAQCLQVGSGYLSTSTPNIYEQDVFLYWTGTITSARLIGYEFNASGSAGRYIKINGKLIGNATGTRSGEQQCQGFEGKDPLSWTIGDATILQQGRNTLRIEIDPARTGETSWGISRAQIEVTGTDVDGRHYKQVTIPSTYYNNWSGYANQGTYTHIMEPQGYDASKPTPLLISAHGFGSVAWDSIQDYHDAAASRGWLLASADYHGEVWNDSLVPDSETGVPVPGVGRRTMGSRASQWDILDVLNYMQAHYNVDPTRIYLVGHSMGGMTALLAGARYADKFAAVVSDSAPTDLSAWEDETQVDSPAGATPNASINHAIRTETGVYLEPTHYPDPGKTRQGPDYPFEYQRRSPIEWAPNYEHLPLWILHPSSDTKVLPHHAEDMYQYAQEYGPAHLERTYFPGAHGDRINGADFANTQLNWLAQYTRPVNDAPQPLNFNLDTSGSHFWMSATFSTASLSEAHWLRVRNATYDRRLQTIQAEIENLKPMSGDKASLGVPAPKNMAVTLTIDVAATGLPATGAYTLEQTGKDDGSFSQALVTASGGKIQATVPQGAYILKISAGGNPPNTQTLTLRQGVNGYAGTTDTYISSWYPDKNYGASQTLSMRVNGTDPIITGLMRFDVSQVPAGATVRFAVLSLRVTTVPNNRLPLEVDRLTRAWKAGEATWNQADATTPWTAAGASNVPGDRAGAPDDLRTIYPSFISADATTTVSDWYGFDVTRAVQGWIANPASNFGLALRVDLLDGAWGSAKDGFSIAGGDYGTTGNTYRPQLSIVYTQDTLTPTPTNTSTATATPTATATATMTPTPTATPVNGSIHGVVFLDSNRNGVRDPGESGISARVLEITQTGEVPSYFNSAADGSFSADAVHPGVWQVLLMNPPAGYVVTTAAGNPAVAAVQSGATTTVNFGMAPAGSPTPTATVTPCPTCRRTYLPLILNAPVQ